MRKRFDEALLSGEIGRDGSVNSKKKEYVYSRESFDHALLYGKADRYGNKTNRETAYSRGSNVVTDEEREEALKKAREALKRQSNASNSVSEAAQQAAAYQTSGTLTADNYEQQKEKLKNQISTARKNKFISALENIYAHLDVNNSVEDEKKASENYKSAKEDLVNAKNKLKDFQNSVYANLPSNSDFVEKSQYDDTIDDIDYKYINASDEERSLIDAQGLASSSSKVKNSGLYREMNADQIAIYNYIYSVFGKSEAKNYIKELSKGETGKSYLNTQEETGKKIGEEYPAIAQMIRSVSQPIEGVSNILGMTQTAGDSDATKSQGVIAFSQGLHDSVSQKVVEKAQEHNLPLSDKDIIIGNTNYGNVYNNLYEAADQAVRNTVTSVALGGGITGGISSKETGKAAQGIINLFISSGYTGQSAYNDIKNGATAQEAYSEGIKNGVIEFATEMLGGFGGAETGNVIADEALEEVFGNLMNNVYDLLIKQDQGEIAKTYNGYIDNGASSKEAVKNTIVDLLGNDLYSASMAALSSGMISGASHLYNKSAQNSAYRAAGRAVQAQGRQSVNSVINEGLSQNAALPTYRAAAELIANSEIDSHTGEIVSEDKMSGRNLGRLGRLQQMNVQANDNSAFAQAVENEDNADSLTQTFERITQGKSVSRKAANELIANKQARLALSRLTDIDTLSRGEKKINNRELLGRVADSYRVTSMTSSLQNSESSAPVTRTIIHSDGTADSVESINRVENGTVYLNTAGGSVVEADSVDFADDTAAQLYKSAAAYVNTDTAKVYTFGFTDNGYNGSLYDYNTGFNAVYRAQKQGYSLEDAYNLARESSSITPMQAELAYIAASEEDGFESKSKSVQNFNDSIAAKGGSKYSLNEEFGKDYDFESNIKIVTEMKPVTVLSGNAFAKGSVDLITQVSDFFKSIGNKVMSKYGSVTLNRTGVKSSVSHGIGRNKVIAFKAVPDVIQNGYVIDYKENYKGRDYDTAVFSAPVTINNEDYFVAAVVNVNKNSNEYYLHEVAIQNKKEDETLFKTGNSNKATPSNASSSIHSLLEKLQNVNKQSMQQAKMNTELKEKFEKALRSKKKPGVTIVSENLTKSQKAESDLIGEYAKSIGREVIVVDDTEELGYGAANGLYENGKIVLALNNTGGVMSVYFGHELFHDLKQTAPAQANELQAYVLDRLKSNADYDYNARFADLEDKYGETLKGKTDTQKKSVIDEEIAANACFTVLSNENNFTALVKQNRSLAQRVRDFFADFIEKIKNALTRLAKNNAEYRALQNDTEAKEKILAMFNKALESSDKDALNNNEIRLSKKITDSLDSFTNEVLDMNDEQARKYKADNTYVSIMTNTPSVILDNVKDAENLEVIMRFDAFYLETRKSGVLDGNYHNLGVEMSKLPKYISNPDAIIRNQNGRLNLITAVGTNNNRLISIELNTVKDINSKNQKYNLVVSVFNSGENYLNNIVKKAIALEYEKEDLPQVNHQLHESLATINDKSSNNTVPQNDTAVNNKDMQSKTKFSLKNSDQNAYEQAVNANDLETAQRFVDKAAIEWGALTDDNGKPLKLYHGTTNQEEKSVWNSKTETFDTYYKKFTVFKNQYEEQSGYFFNSNKDNAGGYGSTLYEVYLKMNKPLIVNCHNENYSAITYEGEVKDTYEWAEYARDKGYDGVIFKNISDGVGYNDLQNITDDYVVFNSSQIKSAETITYDDEGEVIPLNRRFGFYQDIRFSMKETSDYSYESLVSKQDMPVTVINDQKDYTPGKTTRENVVNEAQRSALSVGRKNSSGNVYVYVNDTDTEVMLSKRGLRHSLDRRLSIIAPVTENIGPIIKNSVRINELSPEFETIKNSYVLVGIAKNQKDEPYVVSFVVNRASNEVMSVDVLYAVNAKKEAAALIEPELSSQSDVSLTASTISISDLLDYVNRYYPDILPEDVLRHYGYAVRPDGMIGESALYSLKEEDNTSIFEDNEELNEAAKDVQNMLRLVSTENNELRKVFDIRTVRTADDSSVAKVAAYLRKQYDSTYKKSDLVSNLAGLYNYITNAGENIDNEYVWRTAKSIAANVLANTYYKDTAVYEENKALRDRIRSQTIRVPESVKKDITDYNAFRKRNFGRMRLSNDSGISLDELYKDLSTDNPEFFPPDAVLGEQFENIENFFVATAPVYYNGAEMMAESEGLSLDEYTNIVAADIFNKYFDVPEVKEYVSESHQREMQEIKADYETQIKDMRSLYRQRYEDQLAEIRRENEKRFADMKDKNDAALKKIKERNLETIAKQKAHFKDVSKRATQRRIASKIRESIRRNLRKIARMGAKPDKKNHIPNAIIDSVKAFADAIVLDDTKQDQKIRDGLNQFRDAFESVGAGNDNSQYAVISELYNDFIKNKIIKLNNTVGDKTIKQLSVSELTEIDKFIKATAQTINNINRLFLKERNATIEQYANRVRDELSPLQKEKVFNNSVKSLMFNSMKPEYFFQYLGSDAMLELYHDLRHGEDVWAVDVSQAREKALELRKKYGWHNWDSKTKRKFNSVDGEIELTLQERLGIYANSLGEHTKNHLLGGGFKYQQPQHKNLKSKFNRDNNDNSAHRLSEADVSDIVLSLTDDQMAYVRDMIEYLSTVMGAKGNEISRVLYDMDLFTEKMYYPAKVDSESRHQSSKDVRAEKQIKNAGFTNAAIQDAKQPIILMDFDDVWASHVDEMSKYHAFVLPLENLDRVYNLYSVNNSQYTSVKELIKNSHGNKAINYIDDLIKDINGGVVQEAGTDILSSLTSKFKKNAVFASMSVTIQQPSAIARALSEVDAKYFTKTAGSGFNRKSYEEMKKYAPIAIIKEMGYFDTNMAQNTVDYLNKDFYKGVKEKWIAFWKDGAYRDDVMTFFASKADEITWTHIWNAVKAETKAKHPELSDHSEQLLKKAGERFTEVVTKTQVYDSVFSRSGLMRSRDNAVKNVMSFMAEPTTSLNMFTNAVVQVKRGKISKKHAGKVFGSLVAASVLNSLLQTIVTAARADDDDKEYAEVYLAQLLPNFIDNLNPINQIAFLKDIVSIFQGYDVTRADMNLFSDLYNAIQKFSSETATTEEKITGFAGALSAFFGFPLKNIIRDVKAAVNVGKDIFDQDHFSSDDALDEFKNEMNSYLGFDLFNSDLENAVKGVRNDDMELYEKYADKVYESDSAYDLLYEVAKADGVNSSAYLNAKRRIEKAKEADGVEHPDIDGAMKERAIKDYAKERTRKKEDGGDYNKTEPYRQLCLQLFGDMTAVEEALKKYQEKQEKKNDSETE